MTFAVSSRSRGADAVQGLLSLVGLLVLVVAIPVLLVNFIGWPLPRSVPSLDDITAALGDQYVPDRFLVGALACVCWIVWAELVASVVVEVQAQIRGQAAGQVPLAGGMQKAAARLVAGVALLVAVMAARGVDPAAIKPLVPAPSVPTAQVVDMDVEETPAADEHAVLPTYTVQHRDTLWDISEQSLGDPFRWSEIWKLNENRQMGDGRSFTDPDLILPGWVLSMPADAIVPGVPADAPDAEATPPPSPPSDDGADDDPSDRHDDGAVQTGTSPAGGGTDGGGPRVEVFRPVGSDADGAVLADGRVEVFREPGAAGPDLADAPVDDEPHT